MSRHSFCCFLLGYLLGKILYVLGVLDRIDDDDKKERREAAPMEDVF